MEAGFSRRTLGNWFWAFLQIPSAPPGSASVDPALRSTINLLQIEFFTSSNLHRTTLLYGIFFLLHVVMVTSFFVAPLFLCEIVIEVYQSFYVFFTPSLRFTAILSPPISFIYCWFCDYRKVVIGCSVTDCFLLAA